jgi:hypothetical protein
MIAVRRAFTNRFRRRTTCSLGWIPILAAIASLMSAASHPPDRPHLLTTVAQVRALTGEQANKKYPIHLKGVITYRGIWTVTARIEPHELAGGSNAVQALIG